jgi:O-antigen ligase
MRTLLPSGPTTARWLRRGVLAIGAAAVLVLPQFSTNASFVGVQGLPGPLVVLAIGLALWMMPVLLVASWVAEGRATMPHPWLAVPAGLFVAGAALSTAFAADQSSALVRAAEMTGLWVGLFALVQALRSDAQRRFLLASLLAAAVISAAVAIHQGTVGLAQTWEYFQEHREEILAARGIEPGSWMERLFVGRFFGGVQASLGHPNVLAAFLTLGFFVAVGLAREKWSEAASRGARAVAVAIAAAAVVCAVGLVLTQSRAGEAAVVVGLYWLAVAWWVRRRRLRIGLYLAPLAVAAVALVVATQIDHPVVAGALTTLRYRLDYWQATLAVLCGNWDTGVGLENFGLHYLEHKLPWAPEEVADPHNMLLATWSSLGLAGATALVLLAAAAIRVWIRGTGPARDGEAATGPAAGAGGARGEPLLALLVPAIAVAAPVVVLFFSMGWYVGVGAVAVVAMIVGLGAAEEPSRLEVSGRPLRALRTACIVALAAFALEEQIGTAVLEPPTTWAMLLVLGASLGPGRGSAWRGEGRGAPAVVAAGGPAGLAIRAPLKFLMMVSAMAMCFLYAACLILPVGREQSLLTLGMYAGVNDAVGEAALREAARINPVAWEPAMIRGRLWEDEIKETEGPAVAIAVERAIAAYRDALARQPRLRRAYLALADCYLALPGATENRKALEAARTCLESAAWLYPTDIRTRLRLAEVAYRLGDAESALAHYREIKRLDGLMPDEGCRLNDEGRELVETRIGELSGAAPAATP